MWSLLSIPAHHPGPVLSQHCWPAASQSSKWQHLALAPIPAWSRGQSKLESTCSMHRRPIYWYQVVMKEGQLLLQGTKQGEWAAYAQKTQTSCWLPGNSFYFFIFLLFRATPVAYGSSQARCPIRAAAASLRHSHSNARSELCLWRTPQLADP